jgi:four helix bundle protein
MVQDSYKKKFDLENRLIDFAVQVINVSEALPRSLAGNHIAGQLLRSGTSPASNYGEAQSAESRKDFIHKMKLALKELRESQVWLKILQRKELAKDRGAIDKLSSECNELIAIFVASIRTATTKKEPVIAKT